jgi:hypothetical protein
LKNTVRLLAISLSIVTLIGPLKKAEATDSSPNVSTSSTSSVEPASPDFSAKVKTMTLADLHPELVTQLKSHKGGSIEFWEAVSWCETNHKWNDGGYFSGGLGMAQSVWVNYGGKQFASRPSKATKEEQIIVANRMAFFGFQTKNTYGSLQDKIDNKPYFRPAVGWRSSSNWGKDCVNWKTRKPRSKKFTESKVSKTGKVSAMGISNQKSCPAWEAVFRYYKLPVKQFSYIAWRESRCSPKAVSRLNSNGTKDYGLLQINSSWKSVTANVCHSKFGDMGALLNYKCNMKVAKWLLEHTSSGLGNWSTHSGTD